MMGMVGTIAQSETGLFCTQVFVLQH